MTIHADVLLTADRKHFGDLMERKDLPVPVLTVREFLLHGPMGLLPGFG
ncbi:MAG: hypothetical protein WD273_07790 [Trueperaceae bacterium]